MFCLTISIILECFGGFAKCFSSWWLWKKALATSWTQTGRGWCKYVGDTNLGIFLSKNLSDKWLPFHEQFLWRVQPSCHYWSQVLAQWDFCRGMMYRMEGQTSVTWSQNSSHPLCIRIWEHRCHCPACQLDCTPRTSWSELRNAAAEDHPDLTRYAKLLLKCRNALNLSLQYDNWKWNEKWRLFAYI